MNIQLGYNAAGFMENRSPMIDADVETLSTNSLIYERAPGGAITSKSNPFVYRSGWGINMDCINAVLPEGEVDEDGADRDKWIQKMNEQPAGISYMDTMIERHLNNPNLRLIWVANCLSASVEDNFAAISYMVENGVRITHVEADNEAYGRSKYNFDFYAYAAKFQPLFDLIKAAFPEIKCSVFLAPFNKGVQAHAKWNDAAAWYMQNTAVAATTIDNISIHFYYNSVLLPDAVGLGDAFDLFPAELPIVDFTTGNESLQKCFDALKIGLMNNGGFIDEIADAKEKFPDKKIIITEFNCQPAEYFCNTLACEAWIFMMYLMRDAQIDALCVHNGNSPAMYGRWTNTMRQDLVMGNTNVDGDRIRRLGFFAMQLLSEIDGINNFPISDPNLTIATPGKYSAWFLNMEAQPMPHMISIPVGYKLNGAMTINYLQGSKLYSSSGSAGWMNKEQPASYEIAGITRGTYDGMLPSYSFGYYAFEIVKEVIVPTTEKPKWWKRFWTSIFGRRINTPKAPSGAVKFAWTQSRII